MGGLFDIVGDIASCATHPLRCGGNVAKESAAITGSVLASLRQGAAGIQPGSTGPPVYMQEGSSPSWLMPAGLAAGALAFFLAVK